MVSEHFPWADIVGKYFLFLQIFFRSRKKRVATLLKFLVHFCAKFVENGCRYEFLLEKYPILKRKLFETEFGKSRYWSFKIYKFSGFFPRTAVRNFFSVAFGGQICPNKLQIWVSLTISPNFKKKLAKMEFEKWS